MVRQKVTNFAAWNKTPTRNPGGQGWRAQRKKVRQVLQGRRYVAVVRKDEDVWLISPRHTATTVLTKLQKSSNVRRPQKWKSHATGYQLPVEGFSERCD